MHRDTESEPGDYISSIRHFNESNYWSDDNIWYSCGEFPTQLFDSSFLNKTEDSESKAEIITDENLTPGMAKNSNKDNSKKSSHSVVIDETQNQVHNLFAPGSRKSPSMLDDNFNPKNKSQDQLANISGHKRSDKESRETDIKDDDSGSPPKKRQRKSKVKSNMDNIDNNNPPLTRKQLQDIQNRERENFQAEMEAEGIIPADSRQQLSTHSSFADQFDNYDDLYDHEDGGNQFDSLNGFGLSNQQSSSGNNQNSNTHRQQSDNSNRNYRRSDNNNNNSNRGNQNHGSRRMGAGGGPGDDPNGDGDDDKDDKHEKKKKDDDDSDSQSEDSENSITTGITAPNSKDKNNTNDQLAKLQQQNDELKQNLEQSDQRVAELLSQISNPASNGNSAPTGSSSADINIYQELIKQQQLQMQQLMVCHYINRNIIHNELLYSYTLHTINVGISIYEIF